MDPVITTYFHCAKCIDEIPEGESPQSYARLSVGLTADNQFCVWCNRHEMVVGIFSEPPKLQGHCEVPGCACGAHGDENSDEAKQRS